MGLGLSRGPWFKVTSFSACRACVTAPPTLSPPRLSLFRFLNPFFSAPWLFQGRASYSPHQFLCLIPYFGVRPPGGAPPAAAVSCGRQGLWALRCGAAPLALGTSSPWACQDPTD